MPVGAAHTCTLGHWATLHGPLGITNSCIFSVSCFVCSIVCLVTEPLCHVYNIICAIFGNLLTRSFIGRQDLLIFIGQFSCAIFTILCFDSGLQIQSPSMIHLSASISVRFVLLILKLQNNRRLLNQKQDPFETSPFKPRWDYEFVRKYLGTERLPKMELLNYLQSHADSVWLKKWRLTGSPKTIKKSKSCSNLANAYKDFVQHCVSGILRLGSNNWLNVW